MNLKIIEKAKLFLPEYMRVSLLCADFKMASQALVRKACPLKEGQDIIRPEYAPWRKDSTVGSLLPESFLGIYHFSHENPPLYRIEVKPKKHGKTYTVKGKQLPIIEEYYGFSIDSINDLFGKVLEHSDALYSQKKQYFESYFALKEQYEKTRVLETDLINAISPFHVGDIVTIPTTLIGGKNRKGWTITNILPNILNQCLSSNPRYGENYIFAIICEKNGQTFLSSFGGVKLKDLASRNKIKETFPETFDDLNKILTSASR